MEMEAYMLICEDSMDGIFTGIYEAYQIKKEEGLESHEQIHLYAGECYQPQLCMHDIRVRTDREKSQKVIKTLLERLGRENYEMLCMAMASEQEQKADAVYHTVVLGLQSGGTGLFARLQNEYVLQTFYNQRNVKNEVLHLEGFLRFQELEQGILYAKIGPKNRVLPFLMEHFADRLPAENFMIYDETHKVFGLHQKYRKWYFMQSDAFKEEELVYAENEAGYARLFTHFCQSVAIKERTNEELQRNMLPLRFREYMTEFQGKS